MAEPAEALSDDDPDLAADEALEPTSHRMVTEVRALLDEKKKGEAAELVLSLHYADAADLLETLKGNERRKIAKQLGDRFDAEILPELDETVRDEVIDALGLESLAAAVQELDSDDAVYLVDHLGEKERAQVLETLPEAERAFIEEGLSYPDESAGRLMQRELVAVPEYWTVGETIDFLREAKDLPYEFYDIFVVDPMHRPSGKVALNHLLRSKRPVKLAEIANPAIQPIPVTMDQEEVAFRFRQENLVSTMVVDASGRLVGVITIDDVVDVIDTEAADDMLRLAGVQEGDAYRAALQTAWNRGWWLLVNLGTAVLASLVIGMFEATITQVVALAVLMPIVASMGGNAGTQTLTVAVRSLATKELNPANAWRMVGKELMVGLLNGVVFGVLTGGVAYAWYGDGTIGLVIAAAMVMNMLVAGLAGIAIPLALDRMKIDPAVSSGVFLTTVTDVVGFMAFLGLAAAILL